MQTTPEGVTRRRFQLKFLIVAAAIWHVTVAVAVFGVGKYQLFPSRLYPSGIFVGDGLLYQGQGLELVGILRNEGLIAWATWPTQLHVRFYSLPLAILSRWFGVNVLTIEPLNLIYYLAILVLVFKLGEAIYDYQSGLIAAGIVAVWPSLLIHTTQMLRDPLLILAVLVLTWSMVELLRRGPGVIKGLLFGILVTTAVVIIRIVRLPLWYVICATAGVAMLLLAVNAWRERRVTGGAVVFALMVITAIIVTPRLQPYLRNQQELRTNRVVSHEEVQKLSLADQIAASREGFDLPDKQRSVARTAAGSRIDQDVRVRGLGDVVRLLPRAIVVGFFAPFPNMWLQAGRQVGSGGRLLAGVETLLTYMIECLALLGLWRARRSLAVWFLGVFILLGTVALGLAVNNVGALYRLRYPFWILMVIIAAGGLDTFRKTLSKSKSLVP